jgi:xanthine dehydrogenase YagT iron-sulfur-binding subunit
MRRFPSFAVSRRGVLTGGAAVAAHRIVPARAQSTNSTSESPPPMNSVRLTVNGVDHELTIDPRVTLLDAVREHIKLTGSKKGCDHGQCGACTMIVSGRRINSCLTLAVMNDGEDITTIEGLGSPDAMHPMQTSFIKHDGYQCGYCTPGQICSAVAVLDEVKAGVPSHVSTMLEGAYELTSEELRERMSGNICRCAAYSNIIEAIQDVASEQT